MTRPKAGKEEAHEMDLKEQSWIPYKRFLLMLHIEKSRDFYRTAYDAKDRNRTRRATIAI